MIIKNIGKIIDDVYMVGTATMPVYLLDGEKPAIFDAGLAFLGSIYADGIREIIGKRALQYCFVTHSHFDHCGSVSILKRNFPSLKVVASDKVKNVLSRPNAIELIRNLTQAAEQVAQKMGIGLTEFERFEPFEVDITLKDGDRITLSQELTVQALETPGHTNDCLSYFIPQKKVLFCSESAGIPDSTGYIISDCLVDYDRYYDSMVRLNQLDADVLCLGHLQALTDQNAKQYFSESMAHCRHFLDLVESALDENDGDVQRVVQRIKKVQYDPIKEPKQIEAAYLLNLEAKVKVIKKRMQTSQELISFRTSQPKTRTR
jgi:glyoxylase-like metal-dependent hydrolase (beta-lactamase superfamily II)